MKGRFQEQKLETQFLISWFIVFKIVGDCYPSSSGGRSLNFFVSSCQEADAAAEHYFWCMLGLPGMERGLKQLDTVPTPVPPSKAPPPMPPSKAPPLFPPRRLTPAPSRSPTRLRSRTRFRHGRFRHRRLRSPTRPRSRTRPRSPTRLRRHPVKRRERPATEMLPEKIRPERPATEMLPEKIRPERPATEMLLEKIRGSMQGLLERNWVEEFHDHYPIRQNLDAKMIEAWSAVVPMCVFFFRFWGSIFSVDSLTQKFCDDRLLKRHFALHPL